MKPDFWYLDSRVPLTGALEHQNPRRRPPLGPPADRPRTARGTAGASSAGPRGAADGAARRPLAGGEAAVPAAVLAAEAEGPSRQRLGPSRSVRGRAGPS